MALYELTLNGQLVGTYNSFADLKSAITNSITGLGSYSFSWTRTEIVYQVSHNGNVVATYDNLSDAIERARLAVAEIADASGSYTVEITTNGGDGQ